MVAEAKASRPWELPVHPEALQPEILPAHRPVRFRLSRSALPSGTSDIA